MSEKSVTVLVKPSSPDSRDKLLKAIRVIQAGDMKALKSLDGDDLLDDEGELRHQLPSEDFSWEESNGVIGLHLITPPMSFEEEVFGAFVFSLAGGVVEGKAYSTQVGQYTFFDHDDIYDDYADRQWQLLEKPIQVTGETILITGNLETDSYESLAEEIVEQEGTIEDELTDQTTLLVKAGDPDVETIRRAEALGVKVISESELLNAL